MHHFVERFSAELDVPERWPTEKGLDLLMRQSWPGNVRELENVIKRALVLASGDVIDVDDIQSATDLSRGSESDWTGQVRRELIERLEAGSSEEDGGPYWDFVHRLERVIIEEAMRRSGGNQIQAARALGINRNTLRKKLVELSIGGEARSAGA